VVTGWLFDTCLISETGRPQPDEGVMTWLKACPVQRVWTSVLVLGELQSGIALLDDGPRRRALVAWLGRQRAAFGDRCLAIDESIARTWGELHASRQRSGRALPIVDGLIAATAVVRGLAVATRNVADFADVGVVVVNPWAGLAE